MSRETGVLVVDDHPLFREGVKALVDRHPGHRVLAEAGTREEALRLALEIRPAVVLLDLSLPDGGGVDLIRELCAALPGVRVIVVSMHSGMEFMAESFRAGAVGYVVKESAGERLCQALDAAARGEQYLDSAISPKVIRGLMDYSGRKARPADASYAELTRREQQILRLLAEGQPPAEIAQTLFISRKTVENHRTNIMAKLGLRTSVELIRYAARLGLVEVERPWEESGPGPLCPR